MKLRIMEIYLSCTLLFLLPFSSSTLVYCQFYEFPYWFFSILLWSWYLVMSWFHLRWEILRLFTVACGILLLLFFLLSVFVRLVCVYLIKEPLLISLISDSFLPIISIKVIFVSTYKTTTNIDRESDGKIIFPIGDIRDACFIVGLCFDAVVTIICYDCSFRLQLFFESCIHSSAFWWWWCPLWCCSILTAGSPWVNETEPRLFDFNKPWFFCLI